MKEPCLWKSYRIYSSDLNYQLKNKPRIANNVEDADRIVLQAQVTFDRTFLGQTSCFGISCLRTEEI